VTAIVGAGNRGGVDLIWGPDAIYGHFGLDLTGSNGGVVRIDDIEIEDITSAFLRDIMAVVDVRDYGAVGDGVTDDSAAFDRAAADANGRTVLVPSGVFRLNGDVTFDTPVHFEGTVSMPTDKILFLRRNFDYPSYLEAFEDEELAFKKGFQALLNNSDHESFDLGGRKVSVTSQIDMQAAVPNRDTYATRRVIRNGQIEASGSDWDTDEVTSTATYAASNSRTLTNVTNVANVPVGALVEGTGVGREVYVRSKNVGAQTIELSVPLYDAEGTQTFTFKRFKYLLDFSGFTKLSRFIMQGIEFQCNGDCSAIMLAQTGVTFELIDCYISRPKDRGITSIGSGCQGMLIDRCQFLSNEDSIRVADRVSIGFNVNQNDTKIRANRATRFRHFAVLDGSNHIFSENHFFQGDSTPAGIRTAGVVLAKSQTSSVLSNNYVDNCFIEWTNEHDASPQFSSGFSFSALSVTNNVFLSGDVAPWFAYVVIKPHGAGHFLNGVSISDNRFRSIQGNIDRVDAIDTSFSDLNNTRHKDVLMVGNSFHNITAQPKNPLTVEHTRNSTGTVWTVDTDGQLPFNGRAVACDSVVTLGDIRNSSGATNYSFPHVDLEQGSDGDQVSLRFSEAVSGKVQVIVRMDN
jgi:hypothetical protein